MSWPVVLRISWFSECLSKCSSGLPSQAGITRTVHGVKPAFLVALCSKVGVGDTCYGGEGLPGTPSRLTCAFLLQIYRCGPGRKMPTGHCTGGGRHESCVFPQILGSLATCFFFPPLRFLQYVCCIFFVGGSWFYLVGISRERGGSTISSPGCHVALASLGLG